MTSLTDSDKQTRVFIWGSPRSISTCFLKCLSFVEGAQVWHEPYQIAYNLGITNAWAEDPNLSKAAEHARDIHIRGLTSKEIKTSALSGGRLMPAEKFTYPWVKSVLEKEELNKKYIFIKDAAYSILYHMESLSEVPSRHTFIIRHPFRTLTSYRRSMMKLVDYQGDPKEFRLWPELERDYYKEDYVYNLWQKVKESGIESDPIIIDSEDLMNYPQQILKQYLEALGIPYLDSYVKWDESEESINNWKGCLEWLHFGKKVSLFDKAFRSSCFLPKMHVMPKRGELTPDITGIIDRLMPGYEQMYEQRLKPE